MSDSLISLPPSSHFASFNPPSRSSNKAEYWPPGASAPIDCRVREGDTQTFRFAVGGPPPFRDVDAPRHDVLLPTIYTEATFRKAGFKGKRYVKVPVGHDTPESARAAADSAKSAKLAASRETKKGKNSSNKHVWTKPTATTTAATPIAAAVAPAAPITTTTAAAATTREHAVEEDDEDEEEMEEETAGPQTNPIPSPPTTQSPEDMEASQRKRGATTARARGGAEVTYESSESESDYESIATDFVGTCSQILEELYDQIEACEETFSAPVDHIRLGLTDYLEVVREPMDLGTVSSRISSDHYKGQFELFQQDVCLVFDNCVLYNQHSSPFFAKLGTACKRKFMTLLKRSLPKQGKANKKSKTSSSNSGGRGRGGRGGGGGRGRGAGQRGGRGRGRGGGEKGRGGTRKRNGAALQEEAPQAEFQIVLIGYEGAPKGAYQVLWERGMFKQGMRSSLNGDALDKYKLKNGGEGPDLDLDAHLVLSKCGDFAREVSMCVRELQYQGHLGRGLPICCCEYSPIELVWGLSKKTMRRLFALADASTHYENVLTTLSLQHVPLKTIRAFFRKTRDYERSYRVLFAAGFDGTSATSHLLKGLALIEKIRSEQKCHRNMSDVATGFLALTERQIIEEEEHVAMDTS